MEKSEKNKTGRPGSYDELKQTVSMSLTKTAIQKLDELAAARGISRSELIEQIGRSRINLSNPCPVGIELLAISEWDLDQLGIILRLQAEMLGDELTQSGVFSNRSLDPERAETVTYLLEHIHRITETIDPPARRIFRSHKPDHAASQLEPLKQAIEALADKVSEEVLASSDSFDTQFVQKLNWQADTLAHASFGEIQTDVQRIFEIVNWRHCHEQIRKSINQLPQDKVTRAKKAVFYILKHVDTSAISREIEHDSLIPFMNLIKWLSSCVRTEVTEAIKPTQPKALEIVAAHQGQETTHPMVGADSS
jgi:Ribbon-helix-helix protein, copG family